MAAENAQRPEPDPAEVERFAQQSSLVIERVDGQRVSVRAQFVFRTLRYELNGQIDLTARHFEPLQHRLLQDARSVFDLTITSGQHHSRAEYRFGDATQGVREMVLEVEPLSSGVLVTGYADGNELLPLRLDECNCSSRSVRSRRPVLAWNDAASPDPVTLKLAPEMSPELEGLAGVVRQTIARTAGGGGLGDILDIFGYVVCVLECVWEGLVCWVDTLGRPRSDIFQLLCSVLFGQCLTICRFKSAF